MFVIRKASLFLAGWGLIFLSVSCSDPHGGRLEVSGKVTIKGEPLPDGAISFEPMDSQETRSGSEIKNGQYKVERQFGLLPGKYLVRLTAGDGKTPVSEDEAAGPGGSTNIVSVDLIPSEWNVDSQKQIEVKQNSPNQFDFDVPNPVDPKTVNRKKKR